MHIDTYDQWASQEMLWFRNRLIQEDPEAIYESCRSLGISAVLEIMEQRKTDIENYINSPANERERILHQITDEKEKHAFLISAAYKVRCGACWLEQAANHGVSAEGSIAKSQMLYQAAGAAAELYSGFPTLWPFEDIAPPWEETYIDGKISFLTSIK